METQSTDPEYDVLIIGYGPVGRMLALQLGRRGHSVFVVERQRQSYFLPRAVHLDDEAARILQSVGASPLEMSEAVLEYDDFYEWRSADRATLTRLDWRGRGPSGWHVSNFFNQPAIERELDTRLRALPTVEIRNGFAAISHVESDDRVTVELTSDSEDAREVSARYVVGADGANSVVASWIGSRATDLGYFHDWLVVDLIMKTPMEFDPPAWQLCDPARPTTLVPGGPGRRRFEFMRLPHETIAELNDADMAWKLLEPWGIGPAQAELERHTVYTFQARWLDEWRRGRVLIAGDAAHLMPPFAGQGMCSGLRDAANLEWKLHLVLSGLADEDLLDTYGPERKEHVRHFIAASMALGEVICITSPEVAAERDQAMQKALASGEEPEPRPLPRLGEGFFIPGRAGGLLGIQGVVRTASGTGLLDDVTAGGATLLARSRDVLSGLDSASRVSLEARGVQILALDSTIKVDAVMDVEGTYSAWLDSLACDAVLLRPDFYIFGTTSSEMTIDDLAQAFLGRLSRPLRTA